MIEVCCQPFFDDLRFGRASWLQGSGPGSGLACQGSATGDPCNTFLHVFVSGQWARSSLSSLHRINRSKERAPTRTVCPYYIPWIHTRQRITVSASFQSASTIKPNVHVLGQRHTAHSFGMDSVANSAGCSSGTLTLKFGLCRLVAGIVRLVLQIRVFIH